MIKVDELFRDTISLVETTVFAWMLVIWCTLIGRPSQAGKLIAFHRMRRPSEFVSGRSLMFFSVVAALYVSLGFQGGFASGSVLSEAKADFDTSRPLLVALGLVALLDLIVRASFGRTRATSRAKNLLRDALSSWLLVLSLCNGVIFSGWSNQAGLTRLYNEWIGLDFVKLAILASLALAPAAFYILTIGSIRVTHPLIKLLPFSLYLFLTPLSIAYGVLDFETRDAPNRGLVSVVSTRCLTYPTANDSGAAYRVEVTFFNAGSTPMLIEDAEVRQEHEVALVRNDEVVGGFDVEKWEQNPLFVPSGEATTFIGSGIDYQNTAVAGLACLYKNYNAVSLRSHDARGDVEVADKSGAPPSK